VTISLDEVRHIAGLARLGLSPERARAIAHELSSILAHMEVLSRVDTSGVTEAVASGEQGMPLRADEATAPRLARAPEAFAPEFQDGFFLVPRLSTHEDPEASA
jgi:aspartyl-tRNA(Asn)/glutamyl-tRNA(Gln) amidotransferase subunit C